MPKKHPDIIIEAERHYLQTLFAPYGATSIIPHYHKKNDKFYLRARYGTIEREYGEIRQFLSLPRQQQIAKIEKTLPVEHPCTEKLIHEE